MSANNTRQLKSKSRVADHGEVFTAEREVNAMLDLVKQETERIDSRFLEPACGTGNFLVEVLRRKLAVVDKNYKKSQLDYERYAVLAVSSLYGIDLLEDNVHECRQRLFAIFEQNYAIRFKEKCLDECKNSVKYILGNNILQGDALTLQSGNQPIVFPEWSFVKGSMLKRRDYTFHVLLEKSGIDDMPLFSDENDPAFIPEPIKEYPPIHFLKLGQYA